MKQTSEIADCVRRSLDRYFKDLDGAKPRAIYDMVLKNVERPMIELVLSRADGNQTIAASMLGINPGLSDAINIEIISGLKVGDEVAEKPVKKIE